MKRLYRDTNNAMVGGVCSGLGDYFDLDPTLIRLLYVGMIFAFGIGIPVYIIAWIIVPSKDSIRL